MSVHKYRLMEKLSNGTCGCMD